MEQSVPVSEVSSETANGPIPPNNSTFQNIEQQYQEQWHILENLQSELGSEGQSESRQDSVASFNNSTTSNSHKDAESTVNQQEKEGTEEWFILGEDPVGTDQENTSDNKNVGGKENISGTEQEREGETAKQLSPYSEQWFELEQLKQSVRSLSQVAGLPQSPQLNETVASGLSSGSLSVETLEEVGLEEIDAVLQEGRTGEGDILKIEVYNVQYVLPSAPPAVTWGEGKFPGTRFAAKVANEATCV